ncbi:hypothetical protein GCM10023215_15680 [Pseudonocardia yuanmonensis]|uniref:TetR family transcriptional regulator n=1 Tax=Pseudonocardia yuanmonensis TaxID=1095914 RepID=A0ABP8W907_9PSEU
MAKRTVYNIYGGKEALFRAVVEQAITIAEASPGNWRRGSRTAASRASRCVSPARCWGRGCSPCAGC